MPNHPDASQTVYVVCRLDPKPGPRMLWAYTTEAAALASAAFLTEDGPGCYQVQPIDLVKGE